jgi:hypothetical protein
LWGRARDVTATLDYWDDPVDVYAVKLTRRETLAARVQGPAATSLGLELWLPGTTTVLAPARVLRDRVARSARAGPVERIVLRAKRTGWYYVAVRITQAGFGQYTLSLSKT